MDTLEVYLYTLDFQYFANILEKTIGCKHISFCDKSLRSHGHSCDRDRFGVM